MRQQPVRDRFALLLAALRLSENGEGKPERYPMFHIVSPERLIPEGVSVEDLYLPIEERKRAGRDQPRPGAQGRGE